MAESTIVGAVVGHWAEVGVTGSAAALTYVTAFPYHVRKRYHARVRRVLIIVVTRTKHHVRATVWQLTYVLPGRIRRPLWRRPDLDVIQQEEEN